MKRTRITLCICSLLAALLLVVPVQANDQPLVNLGLTSFMDGGPPAGPGFYATQYFYHYSADKITNSNGGTWIEPDIGIFAGLLQFIYQSDQELLLGGKWGLDLIVPIAGFDLDPKGTPLNSNSHGIGDIVVGPYLQWDPIMGDKGPKFMHRIEFQMILPTGKYDSTQALNPGFNFFSFNPYWAGTLFVTPKLTTSLRAHYLFNAANDDPFVGIPGAPSEFQVGQAIHLNFATAYEVIAKRLRVGINGYYLKQITDDEADGQEVPNHREQALAFGPGALFHLNQNNHIFLNTYFETETENRTEGFALVLRLVHHF